MSLIAIVGVKKVILSLDHNHLNVGENLDIFFICGSY
jgi:hypothetical protein